MASEAEWFVGPAGHSQGRELRAKNGSNFLPRLACEETKKDEFNEANQKSGSGMLLLIIWG